MHEYLQCILALKVFPGMSLPIKTSPYNQPMKFSFLIKRISVAVMSSINENESQTQARTQEKGELTEEGLKLQMDELKRKRDESNANTM